MLTLSTKDFLDVDYIVLGFHTGNSYHVNALLYRIVQHFNVIGTED